MDDIYSINKSRFGYAYQYKYALLIILKFMLAGRLKSARMDVPFSSKGLVNLSLDAKLELMNPDENHIYEIKTGDDFKKGSSEELVKVLRSLYLYEQNNIGTNYKKFILISPNVEDRILERWDDFGFIQSKHDRNSNQETQNDVQKRVFNQFNFGIDMKSFIKFIKQITFGVGPSYKNDSKFDRLSDLEDQIESEIRNFCEKLCLRTSEIEIPFWSIVLELLEILYKCSENNKDAIPGIFEKLIECLCRKALLREAKYDDDKEIILERVKKDINKQLISITNITREIYPNINEKI